MSPFWWYAGVHWGLLFDNYHDSYENEENDYGLGEANRAHSLVYSSNNWIAERKMMCNQLLIYTMKSHQLKQIEATIIYTVLDNKKNPDGSN